MYFNRKRVRTHDHQKMRGRLDFVRHDQTGWHYQQQQETLTNWSAGNQVDRTAEIAKVKEEREREQTRLTSKQDCGKRREIRKIKIGEVPLKRSTERERGIFFSFPQRLNRARRKKQHSRQVFCLRKQRKKPDGPRHGQHSLRAPN